MELSVSKCQRIDIYDNKEEQILDKYEGEDEGEDDGYILFFFVALFPPL